MRWFGMVYTPLMAVLGLLLIVLSFFISEDNDTAVSPSTYMIAGAILAAGACIAGGLRQSK